MPVKNTEKYLETCLDSIISQSLDNWELIAVDDHSTDESEQILKRYAAADKKKRIDVLSNTGSGIISALRTAYAQSIGTYITRMDSDDVMTPHKLKLFSNRLKEMGKEHLVTGLVQYFNDSDQPIGEGYRKYADWLNTISMAETNYKDIYKECCIASPNWMVHREDLVRCGAFQPVVYPEDYDLCFRFREASLKISTIKEITHKWRDYPTRTSRTDDNYKDNRFTALKVHHFLKSDYNKEKQLVLWGAGLKGKAIAKEFIAKNVIFKWITDNPKKIGKDIYGVILGSTRRDPNIEKAAQFIIGVSQRGAQEEIIEQLTTQQLKETYFFC